MAKKDTEAYRRQLIYIREYNKQSPRMYIQFNKRTEADIIEWLADKRKATYVKKLIREDMARNGK